MIGMIKKDLLMIKNNYKAIIVAMVLFVFYSITFEMNMTFFLPFMGLMLCISTINYDEYNNWHTYATALPQGKINVVNSKYITTIGITLVLTVVSALVSIIISSVRGTINISESFSTIMGELLAIIFMMSILIPVLFKYGQEKGRMAMIIIGMLIFGIVFLFKEIIHIEISSNIINFLDTYLPIIFIVLSIFLLSISYYFSKKIYLRREF